MNQKPFRTLMLWAVWAATAIITYFTLYRGGEMWAFVQTDQSRITWLIIGLFVFGLIGSFILTILITLEAVVATRVDESVAGKGLKAELIETMGAGNTQPNKSRNQSLRVWNCKSTGVNSVCSL